MATIADILQRFWVGSEWSLTEDDYETLTWAPGNVAAKPTEAQIRARSAETDALIADSQQRLRQQEAMADAPDYLLKAIEVLIEGMIEIRRVLNDVRSTAVPAAHTGSYTAWDSAVVAKLAALRQRVIDLRNIP